MRKTKRVGKLSRRYARALLSAVGRVLGSAGEPTPAQQMSIALSSFAEAWRRDEQLAPFCISPLYSREQRQKVFLAVAQACGVHELALDFLRMMFAHGRAAALPEVAAAFAELADTAAGVVKVELISARELSAPEREEAETEVRNAVGGQPQFHWHVDPALIGGMIVKFEGKVLDGSVKGRLEQIEKELR